MVGAFACPECGQELDVEGLPPGGLIRCDGCATRVEIPFLPRARPARRWRSARERSPWERRALRLGLVLLGLALVAAWAGRVVGTRLRSDRERVLAELVASADAAEAAGRPDLALVEIEAAVARARSTRSGRLDELLARRAGASLREATARLAAVASLDPGRAVGEALTLRDRARNDPALAPLADAIGEAVATQALRQAEADLDLARVALAEGRGAEAFAAAERLHRRAERLPPDDHSRLGAEAEAMMEAAVERFGAAIPPTAGRFVFGSAEAYAPRLEAAWAEALKSKGYLPQPRRSPRRGLWDAKAPFRATLDVVETPGGSYLQTENRATDIDGTIRLEYRGRVAWQNRATVTSQSFPPNLSAYAGGRLGAPDRRDAAVERRLHDDALGQFAERFAQKLAGLPVREAAARTP